MRAAVKKGLKITLTVALTVLFVVALYVAAKFALLFSWFVKGDNCRFIAEGYVAALAEPERALTLNARGHLEASESGFMVDPERGFPVVGGSVEFGGEIKLVAPRVYLIDGGYYFVTVRPDGEWVSVTVYTTAIKDPSLKTELVWQEYKWKYDE